MGAALGGCPGRGQRQGLHDLDSKASTVGEEHGELGHGGPGFQSPQHRLWRPAQIHLSNALTWLQNGRRVATNSVIVVAPCAGWIWLGDLTQHTQFSVLEFGASYGSGGIGALVQPLIGERVFGTLKPNR